MNLREEENRIRELFAELRRNEAQQAPAFAPLWAAAASVNRSRRRQEYFWRIAAAAAVLVMLIPTMELLITSQPPPTGHERLRWQSEVLISQWRAPTDFLLDRPWPTELHYIEQLRKKGNRHE